MVPSALPKESRPCFLSQRSTQDSSAARCASGVLVSLRLPWEDLVASEVPESLGPPWEGVAASGVSDASVPESKPAFWGSTGAPSWSACPLSEGNGAASVGPWGAVVGADASAGPWASPVFLWHPWTSSRVVEKTSTPVRFLICPGCGKGACARLLSGATQGPARYSDPPSRSSNRCTDQKSTTIPGFLTHPASSARGCSSWEQAGLAVRPRWRWRRRVSAT